MAAPLHGPGERRAALLLELFVVSNLAFIAGDIVLAHSVNAFREPAEWIPLGLSIVAPLLLAPALLRRGRPFDQGAGRVIGLVVGALAIVVGVLGLVLHLDSAFFQRETLHDLVYTAPFIAPLAYTGLGLLLVMNRTVSADRAEWGFWVVVLALGGFVGNLVLSLADHAQNGFFNPLEWVPVVAAALCVGFLVVVAGGERKRPFLRLCYGVLAFEVVVAVAGFVLHLVADLGATEAPLVDRFVYGAPLFAPLLFADLAALAAGGLWHLGRAPAAP
ncbi:MAG: hypothetical protein H6745_19900 [Deltaproteobacteria bacterium]|nr:hypothetical protein [Deltaproteobacteria bacterium]